MGSKHGAKPPIEDDSDGGDETLLTTFAIPNVGNRAKIHRFRLSVTAGPDAGSVFTSSGERTVVGTHAAADFLLQDPTISRFHCEITSGDRFRIRDLHSKNGTSVGGVFVQEAVLHAGVTLMLGNTSLRFDVLSDETSLPVSVAERFGSLVGRSIGMRRVFALLENAATGDASVLLLGEPGTGKESAAESLHVASARRERPFLTVDCAAIPFDLLEAELFGQTQGAPGGRREGAFEAARGGTLFLAEVGELDLDLQLKVMRVLERHEVKRIGAARLESVDVRVLAATSADLKIAVNERRFRPDLYYRLGAVEVRIPPLRERFDDLPGLVQHLVHKLGAGTDPDAEDLWHEPFISNFARHVWPENVRELRRYLEFWLTQHGIGLAAGPVDASSPDTWLPLAAARERWNWSLERAYVEEMLRRAGGNVTTAARGAGVDRTTFYRLLWRHGLR